MTIASTVSKKLYTGDGTVTSFPIPFDYPDNSDVLVYVNAVLKTEGTHYSIFNDTVVFVTAPASGAIVTVLRSLDLVQETDLTNNEAFYPEVLEKVFDRLTMMHQQQKEELDRCVKIPVDSTVVPDTYITQLKESVANAVEAESGAKTSETNAAASATASAQSAALAGSPITGLILYVSASGSDSTGDGSSTSPYASINAAVDKARLYRYVRGAVITINVLAGTYTLGVQVIELSQADVIVNVTGAGLDTTTLYFAGTEGIKLMHQTGGTISGLTLIHGSATSTTSNPTDGSMGLQLLNCYNYYIRNVAVKYWTKGIRLDESKQINIYNAITVIDCGYGINVITQSSVTSGAAISITNTTTCTYGICVQRGSAWNDYGSIAITNATVGIYADGISRIEFNYTASANNTFASVNTSYSPGLNTVGNNMAMISDSTASLGFACSKSANGYTKLPNGLIVQWGTIAVASHDQEYDFGTITFPITFPTAVLNVSATMITSASAASGFDTIPGVKAVTTASAQFYSGCTSSGTETYGLYWIAIGY